MEGPPARPRGRRRATKKPEAAAATSAEPAIPAAGGAGAAARPAATDATVGAKDATETAGAADEPKPSLSQQLAKSLKQLSQLGAGSKAEDPGEVDQRRGPAREPAPPAEAVAAAEDEEWERGLGRSGETGQEEEEEWDEGAPRAAAARMLNRLRRKAAALRRRVAASCLHKSLVRKVLAQPATVATAVLLALALVGSLVSARQARVSAAEVAHLRADVEGQLSAAHAARVMLSRQLAELQGSLQQLSSSQVAAAQGLEALQRSCQAQAGTAANLSTQLAAVRAEVAGLQATTAVAAAEAAAAAATVVTATGRPVASAAQSEGTLVLAGAGLDEQRIRQLAREEAGAELDLYAADRTGKPDWALAAGGGAVVAHSPAHSPPQAAWSDRFGALRDRLQGGASSDGGGGTGVHPQANKLLLSPVAQMGSCLPLIGPTGWVDIRLARPIHPAALTYEHIPPSVAYDIRSAPRNLTVEGFTGRPAPPAVPPGTAASSDAGQSSSCGVLLGSFAFDAHARRSLQTFPLAPPAPVASSDSLPGPLIDHFRLHIASNHGHPSYTCVYRLRMHGTPLVSEA